MSRKLEKFKVETQAGEGPTFLRTAIAYAMGAGFFTIVFAMFAVPVLIFILLGNFIFGVGGSDEPVIHKPQTAEEQALSACARAVSREYGVHGYDAWKFSQAPKTAYGIGDGTMYANLSIPFKTADPVTGKKTRTFWVNATCTVSESGLATLKADDWAGQP